MFSEGKDKSTKKCHVCDMDSKCALHNGISLCENGCFSMTKQEQRVEALKAYEAITDPALKTYRAIQEPAWEALQAKLKEIEGKE